MITALGRLEEILRGPDGERAIVEWYNNPITMEMISACRELSRPQHPNGTEAHMGWLALGRTLGANSLVDFLMNPQGYLSDLRKSRQMPVATYGAAAIVKQNEEGI